MEAASGRSIPYEITDRRPGDAAISVADPSQAAQCLGWRTRREPIGISRDGCAWQQQNPQGYGGVNSVGVDPAESNLRALSTISKD